MSGLEWFLTTMLIIVYVSLVLTVCFVTFKKGYTGFGILGFFIPFVWLIAAMLPAKRGSRHDIEEQRRLEQQMTEMTR